MRSQSGSGFIKKVCSLSGVGRFREWRSSGGGDVKRRKSSGNNRKYIQNATTKRKNATYRREMLASRNVPGLTPVYGGAEGQGGES